MQFINLFLRKYIFNLVVASSKYIFVVVISWKQSSKSDQSLTFW